MPHPMKQIPPLRPDYSAAGIAAYVAELEWENRKLKEELEEMRNKSVNVDKFYPILLDPPMVARLQAVSVQTVRAHIKDGAIPKHPDSTDSRTYIRASVALKLDFSELRKGRY